MASFSATDSGRAPPRETPDAGLAASRGAFPGVTPDASQGVSRAVPPGAGHGPRPNGTGRAIFSPLLFRQVCILAAITGMLACRYPAHGALGCALLALFALPFPDGTRSWSAILHKPALFFCAFCLGYAFFFATAATPLARSDYPAWVCEAAVSSPSPAPIGASAGISTGAPDKVFKDGVALTGRIRETTPLADGRVRILLEDVRAEGEDTPLPGSLVLTWQSPPPELAAAGPGQRLVATLRIREIRGFANPGVWETETYWRDRGAYFRAWGKGDGSRNGKNPPFRLEGEPSPFWKIRAALRTATLDALGIPAGVCQDFSPVPTRQPHSRSPARQDFSPGAATIPALLFGDRSLFDASTLERVAKATLAHSLALSGMHLGFAAGIGYGAASLLQLLFPGMFLRLPRQKAGLLLALPVCLLYLWLGGAPPSLVRAALMLLFWGVLLWRGRPKVLVDGLLWAVALILLVTPSALFDIRLQLSAVSVAGIVLVSPLLERLATPSRVARSGGLGHAAGRFLLSAGRVVAGMALISIAAQAAVLPIMLDAFPGTGLWFPLNLVWLPALGMWVMPFAFAGLLATALGLAPLASGLFLLAQIPCAGLFGLLEAMETAGILLAPVALRPAFPAMAAYWTVLLLLPAMVAKRAFSRRTFTLLCVALALGMAPTLQASLAVRDDAVQLRLVDVGQGQAVVVSWTIGGKRGRMLVDGGGFSASTFDVGKQVVAPVLTANTPPRLDWLVNTHPDTDHLQGLLFPLETFSVGRAVFGPDGLGLKRNADVERCVSALRRRNIPVEIRSAGDALALAPGLVMEVLHPGESGEEFSSNNASLVLRLVWQGRPLVLLCGDIERKGIKQMLERGLPLQAQVLVLPHHGSANAVSAGLYDAVRPELALASCGYATSTVRPALKVRAALERREIPLVSTADKGQINIVWDRNGEMKTTCARE